MAVFSTHDIGIYHVDGARKWSMSFAQMGFDTNAVSIMPAYATFVTGIEGDIVLKKLTVAWQAATSGAGNPSYFQVNNSTNASIDNVVGTLTSIAASSIAVAEYHGLLLVNGWRVLGARPIFEWHTPPGPAFTADYMTVVFEGEIIGTADTAADDVYDTTPIQPVSIRDAQIWPWKRS